MGHLHSSILILHLTEDIFCISVDPGRPPEKEKRTRYLMQGKGCPIDLLFNKPDSKSILV
jgi:hypothetical protein